MALYIFSDAHLGAHSEAKESEKLSKIGQLCQLVKEDGDRLVILGDLFDFWFEYKHTAPKEHYQVLFLLSELVKQGIQIDYVSGNHDFWLDDFFETQMKIKLHRDEFETDYGGKRIHFIHGDGLAAGDWAYRISKRIFRNRFNIWLYRKLPPDFAFALAKKVSGNSRERSSKRENKFLSDYQNYAAGKLKDNFDVVVIGHLHMPSYEESEHGLYINSGDFIEHFSYVKVTDDKISLEYLK
ncbi:MAG: UDP-2,3-diacylglucosamine diphosphatase [candidate division Zixibacteria bacterium]